MEAEKPDDILLVTLFQTKVISQNIMVNLKSMGQVNVVRMMMRMKKWRK